MPLAHKVVLSNSLQHLRVRQMIFPEFSSSTLSHLSRRLLMVLMIPSTTQWQNEFQAWDEKLNRRLNSQIYDDYKQVSKLSTLKTESRGSSSCQISKSSDSHNINYFAETSCNKSYYHKSDFKLSSRVNCKKFEAVCICWKNYAMGVVSKFCHFVFVNNLSFVVYRNAIRSSKLCSTIHGCPWEDADKLFAENKNLFYLKYIFVSYPSLSSRACKINT